MCVPIYLRPCLPITLSILLEPINKNPPSTSSRLSSPFLLLPSSTSLFTVAQTGDVTRNASEMDCGMCRNGWWQGWRMVEESVSSGYGFISFHLSLPIEYCDRVVGWLWRWWQIRQSLLPQTHHGTESCHSSIYSPSNHLNHRDFMFLGAPLPPYSSFPDNSLIDDR